VQLVIKSAGTYITQKDGLFRLKNKDKRFDVSPIKIESIVISNQAMITTQAIVAALQNNIDIIFLDGYGNPIGRISTKTRIETIRPGIKKGQLQHFRSTSIKTSMLRLKASQDKGLKQKRKGTSLRLRLQATPSFQRGSLRQDAVARKGIKAQRIEEKNPLKQGLKHVCDELWLLKLVFIY